MDKMMHAQEQEKRELAMSIDTWFADYFMSSSTPLTLSEARMAVGALKSKLGLPLAIHNHLTKEKSNDSQ